MPLGWPGSMLFRTEILTPLLFTSDNWGKSSLSDMLNVEQKFFTILWPSFIMLFLPSDEVIVEQWATYEWTKRNQKGKRDEVEGHKPRLITSSKFPRRYSFFWGESKPFTHPLESNNPPFSSICRTATDEISVKPMSLSFIIYFHMFYPGNLSNILMGHWDQIKSDTNNFYNVSSGDHSLLSISVLNIITLIITCKCLMQFSSCIF